MHIDKCIEFDGTFKLKRPLPWGKSSPNIPRNKRAELVARYFFVVCGKNLVYFYIRSSMAICHFLRTLLLGLLSPNDNGRGICIRTYICFSM